MSFVRARLGVAMLLAVILTAAAAAAQTPSYTFDVDPIRLGMKALEAGRLDDAKARFGEAIDAGYQAYKARYGLAEIAVREGRLDEAEPLYRAALSGRVEETGKADYPEAHAGLGLLLLRVGRDLEASQEFIQATAEKPGLWAAVYGQARIFLKQGQAKEAKALLDRGAKLDGVKDGEDRYRFGMALYAMAVGDTAAAENEALVALALNPAEPEYGTLLASIYERRNVPALAIDAYERALAAPGMVPTAPLLHDLGVLYHKIARYKEARDRYQQAVAIDSTYAPALKDLAHLYLLAKQYDRSAQVYLRYVVLAPKDVDALVELSQACGEIRMTAQALEAARAACAIDSTRTDARLAFARAAVQGKDKAAKSRAAAVYAEFPDTSFWRATDHVLFAALAIEAKDFPSARSSLGRALALDPNLPEAYFQAGMLDLNTERPDSAVANLERAVALDPTSALYHLNLGIADFQARRTRDAIAPFRRALELNGDLTVARVLLGQALAMSDSLGAAEVEYRKVLDVEPANARALRGLGFCAIRKARYAEAARMYEAAARAEPENADGWAGLGNANLGLQNWEAAEAAFVKARAIDPNNPTMKKGWELLQNAKQAGGSN
jgi:tetratricopeptide (TPR) repeat protein